MNVKDGIERFVLAQETTYNQALLEIRNGKKETHWIWFIFPQLRELGISVYNVYYGIRDLKEAEAYFNHPILGPRLIEIFEAILQIKNIPIENILPKPDIKKLKSSMTLFSLIQNSNPIFQKVLNKYYIGQQDENTLNMLIT
jgi:uncharacterized protein (DUF1810 family)